MSHALLFVLGLFAIVYAKTVLAVAGAAAIVLMLLGGIYVLDAMQGFGP